MSSDKNLISIYLSTENKFFIFTNPGFLLVHSIESKGKKIVKDGKFSSKLPNIFYYVKEEDKKGKINSLYRRDFFSGENTLIWQGYSNYEKYHYPLVESRYKIERKKFSSFA